jgi:hypothetical protein
MIAPVLITDSRKETALGGERLLPRYFFSLLPFSFAVAWPLYGKMRSIAAGSKLMKVRLVRLFTLFFRLRAESGSAPTLNRVSGAESVSFNTNGLLTLDYDGAGQIAGHLVVRSNVLGVSTQKLQQLSCT